MQGRNPGHPKKPRNPGHPKKRPTEVKESRKKPPKAKRGVKTIKYRSVGSSWGKVAGAAPWVGGQSSELNPGSSGAITRRRNSPKYKARGKKVIRPRITKRSGK